MKTVSQVMSRGVRALAPTDSVVRAAQLMEELDVGAVPVCEGERLVGMVTDRDIVVRGVALGLGGQGQPAAVPWRAEQGRPRKTAAQGQPVK